jgi:hypothetical protein
MQLSSSLVATYPDLQRALPTAEEQRQGAKVAVPDKVRDVVRVFVDALCENPKAAVELRRRAALVATLTAEGTPYLTAKHKAFRALQAWKATQGPNVELGSTAHRAGHFAHEEGRILVSSVRDEYENLNCLLETNDRATDKNEQLPAALCRLLRAWRDEASRIVSEGERRAADGCFWLVNNARADWGMAVEGAGGEIRRAADVMVAWCQENTAPPAGDDTLVECFVTLQQAAAMVNKSKSALEKRAQKSPLPLPEVEGGGGKAAEWKWPVLRPWLEKEFNRKLPDRFPGERFIRR